ncbi:MAG: hypothetical protein PHQ89_01610 [Bacilli bacterium]|nr:hypothetical protein [Bacilli bacterium]
MISLFKENKINLYNFTPSEMPYMEDENYIRLPDLLDFKEKCDQKIYNELKKVLTEVKFYNESDEYTNQRTINYYLIKDFVDLSCALLYIKEPLKYFTSEEYSYNNQNSKNNLFLLRDALKTVQLKQLTIKQFESLNKINFSSIPIYLQEDIAAANTKVLTIMNNKFLNDHHKLIW